MSQERSKDPIGIFDSGVGGLTVANAIHKILPGERLIYIGDTAHLPYGDKSPDAIQHFALRISEELIKLGCKAIVVACNSAATTAFSTLSDYLSDQAVFVDVVKPLVRRTAELSPDRVGLIATKATIDSGIYQAQLRQALPEASIHHRATPLLVPMIEEGFVDDEVSEAILEEYLDTPEFRNLDVLLLACTHYPLIKASIQRHLPHVTILDSTDVTAAALERALSTEDLLNETSEIKDNAFFVSDYTVTFEKNARLFFGQDVNLKEWDIWDID